MDLLEATKVLAEAHFPGYTFHIHGPLVPSAPTYLQAVFLAADNDRPADVQARHTRKWLLSSHMTASELVQTAFKCVITSIEHEARERFTYKGARVYGPHFDVEALVAACRAQLLDIRREFE